MTDVTTASRTLLLDLRTRAWSEDACALFGLNASELPAVVGCAEEIGRTDAFGPSVAVTGLSVDQQAALIGEHCLEAGDSKCTYGTGAFLLANAGAQPFTSAAGLAVSVAWQIGDDAAYCIDGQVYAAGRGDRLVGAVGLPGPGRGSRCASPPRCPTPAASRWSPH